MAHPVKSVYIRLTNKTSLAIVLPMRLREEPHRLLVAISPELHERLQAEVRRQTTPAHRATYTSVIRALIMEHCAPETVTEMTA